MTTILLWALAYLVVGASHYALAMTSTDPTDDDLPPLSLVLVWPLVLPVIGWTMLSTATGRRAAANYFRAVGAQRPASTEGERDNG